MNLPNTLRAAAHALSDRTDLEHANALTGLLQTVPMIWNATSLSGDAPGKTSPLSLKSTTLIDQSSRRPSERSGVFLVRFHAHPGRQIGPSGEASSALLQRLTLLHRRSTRSGRRDRCIKRWARPSRSPYLPMSHAACLRMSGSPEAGEAGSWRWHTGMATTTHRLTLPNPSSVTATDPACSIGDRPSRVGWFNG